MRVPGFILKRLLTKGGYRYFYTTEGTIAGVEIAIRNRLGKGEVEGCNPIVINGTAYPLEDISVVKAGKNYRASDIGEDTPLPIAYNEEILLRINRPEGFTPGTHTIQFAIILKNIGSVEIEYDDTLES
jgi:hypothetical protein